jgi:hypothetical protein
LTVFAPGIHAQKNASGPELSAPIAVYLQELPAGVPAAVASITEDRALHDLDELARLKKAGMHIDYDLIDAAAIPPVGPPAEWLGTWIAHCRAAGIRPGLRFASIPPQPDLLSALQSWYDRGIRLFVFDDLQLDPALAAFRLKNREAVVVATESTDAHPDASAASLLLSIGPPRPPVWPETSLERAIDIESDSEIRRVEQAGVPLAHILSAGFVAAPAALENPCASCADPALARPWKGDFLLSEARGGRVHPLSGVLDSIQPEDARWMARVQKLFFEVESHGHMQSFGGAPFSGQPYGFAGVTSRGAVYVVVNPGEALATVSLPALASGQHGGTGRILFRDAGFSPLLTGNSITLGPGQMAAVGFGAFAARQFNFGIQQEFVIPDSIEPVDADFHLAAPGVLEARFDPPIQGVLRVLVRESNPAAGPSASHRDAAEGVNHRFTLEITQAGRPIPLRPQADGSDGESVLNRGLPWAVAEVDVNDLTPGVPVLVRFRSNQMSAASLEGSAWQVTY